MTPADVDEARRLLAEPTYYDLGEWAVRCLPALLDEHVRLLAERAEMVEVLRVLAAQYEQVVIGAPTSSAYDDALALIDPDPTGAS